MVYCHLQMKAWVRDDYTAAALGFLNQANHNLILFRINFIPTVTIIIGNTFQHVIPITVIMPSIAVTLIQRE